MGGTGLLQQKIVLGNCVTNGVIILLTLLKSLFVLAEDEVIVGKLIVMYERRGKWPIPTLRFEKQIAAGGRGIMR